MSRIPFQILVYLITALSLTIGFADDVEKAEGKDAADYEEFVGVDISEMSKEELIPFIEGLELPKEGPLKIAVIPVKRDIGNPILYILRRSIKDAMTNGADVVVLDMDTPGGRLDTTLEIMEVLNEFPGITITFINDEATLLLWESWVQPLRFLLVGRKFRKPCKPRSRAIWMPGSNPTNRTTNFGTRSLKR
jgi:membrane-bound ClpP family serine protease